MTAPQEFPLVVNQNPADALGNALALADEAAFDALSDERGEELYAERLSLETSTIIPIIDDLGRPIVGVRLEREDGEFRIVLLTGPAA